MEFALTNLAGALPRDRLFELFHDRGLTREELSNWLESWESQRYRIQDAWYEITRPAGGRPRMMKPVEQQTETELSAESADNQTADDGPQAAGDKRQSEIDEQQILVWALQYNKCALVRDRIFQEFGRSHHLTKSEIESWLIEIEGKKIRLGDFDYMIHPAQGRRPRMIKPIDDSPIAK